MPRPPLFPPSTTSSSKSLSIRYSHSALLQPWGLLTSSCISGHGSAGSGSSLETQNRQSLCLLSFLSIISVHVAACGSVSLPLWLNDVPPHSGHQAICPRKLRWGPPFCSCELLCYEHTCLDVCIPVFLSLGFISGSRTVGSCSGSSFNFWRKDLFSIDIAPLYNPVSHIRSFQLLTSSFNQ